MPGSNVAGAPTLLQELLDHTQRDPITVGNLGPSLLIVVVGRNNSFPEIQRKCSHIKTLSPLPHYGYTIY
jgi:hypothetical protein